jgi:phage baseplate assembly protein W
MRSIRNRPECGSDTDEREGDMMNIDYPMSFDGRGRTSVVENEAHIREMIEELLFTTPGERVNRPNFGSGLMQMIFAPNSPEVASALQFSLQASINQWLGDLIEVQSIKVDSEESILRVQVQYVIRKSGEKHIDSFERGGLP